MFAESWKILAAWTFAWALVICVGCGSPQPSTSEPSETPDEGATGKNMPSTPTVPRLASPDATVTAFLQALKSGDQQRATGMLTSLAQREMARHEATIQPPGSHTANFEVSEIEYVGAQQKAAHVLSVWRDSASDGTASEHEIVWILRQNGIGWAIAGFATRVFPDRPPVVLNFEDPMNLHRKRAAVDAEIARRESEKAPR